MTSPFQPDAPRIATPASTAPALLDDADEPWGYECALPYLQVMGDPPEPGTDASPRSAWR